MKLLIYCLSVAMTLSAGCAPSFSEYVQNQCVARLKYHEDANVPAYRVAAIRDDKFQIERMGYPKEYYEKLLDIIKKEYPDWNTWKYVPYDMEHPSEIIYGLNSRDNRKLPGEQRRTELSRMAEEYFIMLLEDEINPPPGRQIGRAFAYREVLGLHADDYGNLDESDTEWVIEHGQEIYENERQ